MSYKFTLRNLPGGLEITGESIGGKKLFEEVCFWQGLPSICPIDGTDTVLYFKEPKGNAYYSIASTGTPQYQFPLGQLKEGDGMFPKNQWTYWDGNIDVVMWENGRMTPAGVAHIGKSQSVQPTKNNVPQTATPTPAEKEWAALPGVQKGVTSTQHMAAQHTAAQNTPPVNGERPHWNSPPEAYQWSIDNGYADGIPNAVGTWNKVLQETFGKKSVKPDEMATAFDAYYAHPIAKA